MKRVAAYAAAALLVAGLLTGGLLVWFQGRPGGFVIGLAGGMLARMGLVAAVALVATAGGASRPWTVAVVLGLVGYLFALVLLEAWFIQERTDSTQRTERTS